MALKSKKKIVKETQLNMNIDSQKRSATSFLLNDSDILILANFTAELNKITESKISKTQVMRMLISKLKTANVNKFKKLIYEII